MDLLRKCYETRNELDAKTLAVARNELGEKDAKQVALDIEAIREWILKQDYMKSRIDDDFILAFLRAAKYSYSRAQELIGNFWRNRTEMADWFLGRNFEEDSVLMEIADLAIYVKLPYADPEGRVIMLIRMGQLKSGKYSIDDVGKYMFSCLDVACEDPRAQINGVINFLDLTGWTPNPAEMQSSMAQKIMKCTQDAYPLRAKGGNYYNYPKIFDAVFPIFKVFMKEKIKKRIKFHGSDLKSLHKQIPKSILPKEYGGELDSLMKINEAWVQHVKSRSPMLLDMQNYSFDLSRVAAEKRTTSSADGGATGTFRKLNVD